MDFEEKKHEIKTDVIPFLVAIPAFLWINAEAGIGLPMLMAAAIPVIGYVAFAIVNLIGYWLWKI